MKCPECGETVVLDKRMAKTADSQDECQSCGSQIVSSGSKRLLK